MSKENPQQTEEDYMFTKEDMIDFAEWFSDNWDMDFNADSALGIWLNKDNENEAH